MPSTSGVRLAGTRPPGPSGCRRPSAARSHAPDARNLPARVAGSLSTSDLLRLLFGDPSAQLTGGHYWFGYWPVGGQLYTQQG
jgi:hypothetical protein